jgi:hypothetical protein
VPDQKGAQSGTVMENNIFGLSFTKVHVTTLEYSNSRSTGNMEVTPIVGNRSNRMESPGVAVVSKLVSEALKCKSFPLAPTPFHEIE